MILPGNYAVTIILLILTLLFWGSWANTYKLTKKWRYELYYLDFSIGVLLAGVVVAFTFGTMGWDGFSLLDDIRNAGKRQAMFALLAGVSFNLGNMLMLASVSLAGLSVAFPVGLGTALIVGVIRTYIQNGATSVIPGLGSLAVAAGVLLTVLAHRSNVESKRKLEPVVPAVRGFKPKTENRVPAMRAILLALAGGLLMGAYYPLIDLAREGDVGLGPYSIALIFSIGITGTTLVYSLFFMNLPVQGDPIGIGAYLKGSIRQHGLGMMGGVIFLLGTAASLVPYRAEGAGHVSPGLSFGIMQGAPVIAALWGLFAWKEFSDAEPQARGYVYLMVVLFIAGVGAVEFAAA